MEDIILEDDPVRDAFLCKITGIPHQWSYHKLPVPRYRCSLCIVGITKSRLKELTDDA